MSGPARPLTILRRDGAGAPCEGCTQHDATRQELEGQRHLAQERRLEILRLQQELHELRRPAAEPTPSPPGDAARLGLLDGPSIGEIPVTGRRIPRRAEA